MPWPVLQRLRRSIWAYPTAESLSESTGLLRPLSIREHTPGYSPSTIKARSRLDFWVGVWGM